MSSEEENTFDVSAGFNSKKKPTTSGVNPKKIKGRARMNSSDVDLQEIGDGYDDQFIGDSEDEDYLAGLNEYEREKVMDERFENREKKKKQILMKRNLEKEEREKGDNRHGKKNEDLNNLLKLRQQRNNRRKSTEEDSFEEKDSRHEDSDGDFRGSSEEGIDHPVTKKRKTEERGYIRGVNPYCNEGKKSPGGVATFINPKTGLKEAVIPDRVINSTDWDKVNNVC